MTGPGARVASITTREKLGGLFARLEAADEQVVADVAKGRVGDGGVLAHAAVIGLGR
jgi:hypothetical protein